MAEEGVRWAQRGKSLWEFYIGDRFIGMLGFYPERYWLLTAINQAAYLDVNLTEDEARATALVIWRMGLWRK